jgi:pimeloyl-ACP methyl ester carboxylesterase
MLGGMTGDSLAAPSDSSSGGSAGLGGLASSLSAPTDYLGGGEDQASSATGESAGAASEGGGAESGKKPVVIIAHGMGANGTSMNALARQFEAAGYHVETPTDTASPFDGSGVVDAYNKLEAENNPNLDLDNVVLVGHSAGGAAVQQASTQLGDNVAGVITIDGAASMGGTNSSVPHANFSHSGDMLGPMVGNPSPTAPNQSDETLSGGHTTAMSGSDAQSYIDAADEMLGR